MEDARFAEPCDASFCRSCTEKRTGRRGVGRAGARGHAGGGEAHGPRTCSRVPHSWIWAPFASELPGASVRGKTPPFQDLVLLE